MVSGKGVFWLPRPGDNLFRDALNVLVTQTLAIACSVVGHAGIARIVRACSRRRTGMCANDSFVRGERQTSASDEGRHHVPVLRNERGFRKQYFDREEPLAALT